MNRAILTILLCPIVFIGFAQNVEVTTYTYHDDLQLDVYYAGSGNDRPLVVFMHGGGFSGGSRERSKPFCEAMAARGIVVASISYRLTMSGRGFGCDIPAADKVVAIREAGRDGAHATAFLLTHAREIGFDPEKVMLAGSSAGAEAILHLAFWRDARQDASGTILPDNFEYAGAISLAGAIMDPGLITEENALPLMMVHGTCDDLVPYTSAPHHYCGYSEPGFLMLHGAGSISGKYRELGAPYALYTICGGDHSWSGTPLGQMQDQIFAFIDDYVVEGQQRQLHAWEKSSETCAYPGVMVCED